VAVGGTVTDPSTHDDTSSLVPYTASDGTVLVPVEEVEAIHRAERALLKGQPLPIAAFNTLGHLAPSWQVSPGNERSEAPDFDALFEEWQSARGDTSLKPVPLAFTETLTRHYHFIAPRDTETLYHYEQGVYNGHAKAFIQEWVQERFQERGLQPTIHFVRETLEAVRRSSYVDRSQLNPPNQFCLANGILDLTDGDHPQLLPHDPNHYFLSRLPVRYDPTARCPQWEAAIRRALPEPQDQELLQQMAGYILVNRSHLKKAFFFLGPANTGKSMFFNVLKGVLGEANVAALSLQELVNDRFGTADLYGKLANFRGDLSTKAVRDLANFLMAVGRDNLRAQNKYEAAFHFTSDCKLFFAANRTPVIADTGKEFWIRWSILHFQNPLSDDEIIPNYEQVILREEASGVLNWMIEGRQKLLHMGHFIEPRSSNELRLLWRARSNAWETFVETRLAQDPKGRVDAAVLKEAWEGFCDEVGLDVQHTARWVSERLHEAFPSISQLRTVVGGRGGERRTYWLGVRLLPSVSQAPEGGDGGPEGDLEGGPPVQRTLEVAPEAPREPPAAPGPSGTHPSPSEAPGTARDPSPSSKTAQETDAPDATAAPKGLSWTLRLRSSFTLPEALEAGKEMGIDEGRVKDILQGLRASGELLGEASGPFRWGGGGRRRS
jgi:P4 family phage/plasmid primase-like protien